MLFPKWAARRRFRYTCISAMFLRADILTQGRCAQPLPAGGVVQPHFSQPCGEFFSRAAGSCDKSVETIVFPSSYARIVKRWHGVCSMPGPLRE